MITVCTLGNFSCLCCRLLTFFKINFSKKKFRNIIRVSNGLDPDQDRHSVGPDLGPNCLQRLSADDKSSRWQGKIYYVSSSWCSELAVVRSCRISMTCSFISPPNFRTFTIYITCLESLASSCPVKKGTPICWFPCPQRTPWEPVYL